MSNCKAWIVSIPVLYECSDDAELQAALTRLTFRPATARWYKVISHKPLRQDGFMYNVKQDTQNLHIPAPNMPVNKEMNQFHSARPRFQVTLISHILLSSHLLTQYLLHRARYLVTAGCRCHDRSHSLDFIPKLN